MLSGKSSLSIIKKQDELERAECEKKEMKRGGREILYRAAPLLTLDVKQIKSLGVKSREVEVERLDTVMLLVACSFESLGVHSQAPRYLSDYCGSDTVAGLVSMCSFMDQDHRCWLHL